MANVLITIKSLYESFPDTQRQLADYIAEHPDEVPFLSVHELAQLADVSVATISRFARTIGYDSYKEFKTDLGKDSLAAPEAFSGIYQAISSADGDDAVIEKVFRGNINSLNNTLKILDHRELVRAAEILSRGARGFLRHRQQRSYCAGRRVAIFSFGDSGRGLLRLLSDS